MEETPISPAPKENQMTNKELWQTVLAEIELILSPTPFKTFFSQTELLANEKGLLKIACPTTYIKNRVEQNYYQQIKEIVNRITKKENFLKFVVKPSVKSDTGSPGPLFDKAARTDRGIGLSPHYTFENFVVGNNNNLAHAVAQAVVERPGIVYNPFFLYSGVGLGKTHLIQAIGNEVLGKHPHLSVLYCTGESFTNELIDSIQSGSRRNTAKFRNKFRSIDILLIDDVQFIAGREGTQEEFFHTFNALYMTKKQIVLTSDRPPKEIAKLEERLSSRFAGGIIADMQPPDLDVRVAILRRKAESLKVAVPDEVIDTIAAGVSTNIRELEGVFHQALVSTKTKNLELSKENVEKILGEKLITEKTLIVPQEIIKTVCSYYTIKPGDIRGRRRLKEFVRPRQVAMYLLRDLTEAPLTEIAGLLGRSDHTTALHGVKKIERLIQKNPQIREQVRLLRSQICG
jgi:chromosomal replication initiator protein